MPGFRRTKLSVPLLTYLVNTGETWKEVFQRDADETFEAPKRSDTRPGKGILTFGLGSVLCVR